MERFVIITWMWICDLNVIKRINCRKKCPNFWCYGLHEYIRKPKITVQLLELLWYCSKKCSQNITLESLLLLCTTLNKIQKSSTCFAEIFQMRIELFDNQSERFRQYYHRLISKFFTDLNKKDLKPLNANKLSLAENYSIFSCSLRFNVRICISRSKADPSCVSQIRPFLILAKTKIFDLWFECDLTDKLQSKMSKFLVFSPSRVH